jgi:hypothetical protein
MAPRTLSRMLRTKTFPIPQLPSLDSHRRWSGADVQAFLDSRRADPAFRRRA